MRYGRFGHFLIMLFGLCQEICSFLKLHFLYYSSYCFLFVVNFVNFIEKMQNQAFLGGEKLFFRNKNTASP
jgi:hypothetical protein